VSFPESVVRLAIITLGLVDPKQQITDDRIAQVIGPGGRTHVTGFVTRPVHPKLVWRMSTLP
jgi:hypothetical protein